MKKLLTTLSVYFDWFYIPKIHVTDIIEIIILSYVIYHVMLWFKRTRAWTLFKGIVVLFIFVGLASLFRLNTILWIFRNTINVGIIAVIILFQPELRRALEELGRKKILSDVLVREDKNLHLERVNDHTIDELVAAAIDMGKVKTGALIVIEQDVALGEYENTGILIDAALTRQLLINIFEHNTPLHDGAVIVRENRIVAATCYLPLSDNMELSKQLGTRHRAGVGISEVTDSVTIIVSEETGQVSVAQGGRLIRNISSTQLRDVLEKAQNKKVVDNNRFRQLLKGRVKHEEKTGK